MSSATNDKRGKLEQEFQDRMQAAEATPSQQLWDRIDHELTVQENGEYRKRALFYRQLAAACVALLVLVGVAGAYYFGSTPSAEPKIAATLGDAAQQVEISAAPVLEARTSPHTPDQLAAAAQPLLLTQETPELGARDASVQPKANQASRANSSAGIAKNSASGSSSIIPLAPVRTQATTSVNPQKDSNKQSIAMQSSPAYEKASEGLGFKEQSAQAMAVIRQQEEAQREAALAARVVAAGTGAEKQEQSGRWSLAMAYAPGYFNQNISTPGTAAAVSSRYGFAADINSAASLNALYMEEAKEEYEEYTGPGFSYGLEVKTGLRLWDKLKLLAGIGYLQNTARSRSSYVLQQAGSSRHASMATRPVGKATVFVPSISASPPDSLMIAKAPDYTVNYRYRHLTIPVGLQYEGNLNRDWFLYGGAGVAANILLQATVLASDANVEQVAYKTDEASPFRKVQWSGNMSAGIGRRLSGKVSVTLGPEVRGYFNTMLAASENRSVKQRKPYTIGVQLAVNYDLRSEKK